MTPQINPTNRLWACLSPLTSLHACELFDLTRENRSHLRTWLPWADHIAAVQDTEKFVRTALEKVASGTELHYIVTSEGRAAGVVSVIDIELGSGTVGYWIGQPFEGKGYMTAAVQEVKRICFQEKGFTHLNLEYLQGNTRSARVAARCGFLPIATIKGGAMLHGQTLDRIINRCHRS